MTVTKRIVLSVCILLVDLVIFFLPLSALFLVYVLLYNPPWFRQFLNSLDGTVGSSFRNPQGRGGRRGRRPFTRA